MEWKTFLIYLLVMAGVTYLIRMLPLAAIRGKVKSVFLQSFLYYVPYAVLGAMTFPAVFSATGNWVTALAGTVVALILGWMEKGLLTVAALACLAALLAGFCGAGSFSSPPQAANERTMAIANSRTIHFFIRIPPVSARRRAGTPAASTG